MNVCTNVCVHRCVHTVCVFAHASRNPCRDSCELVHIDFSVCFDKGAGLAVPEVVPFRLTQMMQVGHSFVSDAVVMGTPVASTLPELLVRCLQQKCQLTGLSNACVCLLACVPVCRPAGRHARLSIKLLFCMSACLQLLFCMSSCLCNCFSVCLPVFKLLFCMSACLCDCCSVCLPVCLCNCFTLCLPVYQTAILYVCLSIKLPFCMSACLSNCISVCLPVRVRWALVVCRAPSAPQLLQCCPH